MSYPDLARQHAPVSSLFPQPCSATEWDRYRLPQDQVDFFHEYGYLKGLRVLNDEQVEVLRKELAEIADPKHPGHPGARALLRVPQQRVGGPEQGALSLPGPLADHPRLS
jgi:hypothetical protein